MSGIEAVLAALGESQGVASEVVEQLGRSVVLVHSRGGHGSGVVWNAPPRTGKKVPGSLIVTNDHVVPTREAYIEGRDGEKRRAKVVARDEGNDLALLWVDKDDLPPAPIGDARGLKVGEIVVAVGHPWGVRNNASLGIVSRASGPHEDEPTLVRSDARGRWWSERRELLQADVALAPGNSGGPLADAQGRVVGIACMIAAPGIALAVPAHLATRLASAVQR